MAYLYETHLHTSQSSSCGSTAGRDYVKRYLDLGYAGIIITDHFYRGPCVANKNLPWDKWVHAFCKGYEDAREEGARRGLDVFFGWEETFNGDDYLVYGLDKEWLLEHPEVRRWTRKEQFDETRRFGGCVVQAHPFRQHHYIHRIVLSPGCVDAVEVANGGNNDRSFDALAWAYAKKAKLTATAGTDVHDVADMRPEIMMGVYLEKKMENISEFVEAVRGKSLGLLKIPRGHCDLRGTENVKLPVDIRNKQDKSSARDVWDFLGL